MDASPNIHLSIRASGKRFSGEKCALSSITLTEQANSPQALWFISAKKRKRKHPKELTSRDLAIGPHIVKRYAPRHWVIVSYPAEVQVRPGSSFFLPSTSVSHPTKMGCHPPHMHSNLLHRLQGYTSFLPPSPSGSQSLEWRGRKTSQSERGYCNT